MVGSFFEIAKLGNLMVNDEVLLRRETHIIASYMFFFFWMEIMKKERKVVF